MFELSLPWDMDTVSGVKASGVVVEQFEDAGEGRCRRSWSITTRSLDFPGLSNRGSAAEVSILQLSSMEVGKLVPGLQRKQRGGVVGGGAIREGGASVRFPCCASVLRKAGGSPWSSESVR